MNYYISNSGNDSNSGTSEGTAWETLEKVATAAMDNTIVLGDHVLFRKGDVFYGSMVISTWETPSGDPIVFGSYGTGDKPVITGFTTVSNWTNLGGNIWESTNAISTISTCEVVVINGVNTAMGRFPNTGYLTYESFIGNTSITSNSLTGTPNWTGAEVVIRKNPWIIDRCPITSQSGGTLNYSDGNSYPGKNYYGFFIQNDPRTLDTQNDWYFNPTTKKIQVYSIEEPTDVKVASVEHLVSMLYKNSVKFDGISFEGGNISAIHLGSCKDITIINSDINFCYNGLFGEDYGLVSSNFIFTNNSINKINNNGIELGSEFSGAIINYNTLDNCGMLVGMSGKDDGKAQSIYHSSDDVTIKYNRVNNSGYNGISSFGDNTIVSHNFVKNSCMIKDDGAAIYCYVVNGQKVTKNIIINSIGNVEGVDSRYGVRSSAFGIYLDNFTSNSIVEGNTVANSTNGGVYLHDTNYTTVDNNLIFDCEVSLLMRDEGTMRNNMIINNKFISKSLPTNNYYGNPDFSQLAMELISPDDNILLFGTFDDNYYARPISDGYIINIQPNGGTSTPGLYSLFNLPSWRNYSGQDINSQGSPVAITDESKFRFEYNDTEVAKIITLDSPMIDITGVQYSGDITIEPYGSIVLIEQNIVSKKLLKFGDKLLINGNKLLTISS